MKRSDVISRLEAIKIDVKTKIDEASSDDMRDEAYSDAIALDEAIYIIGGGYE